mgnify:CR=1 FL=1
MSPRPAASRDSRARARSRRAQAAGLGAGISWAIADDFGEKMVPLFKENDFRLGYDFVTAESLNDALQRAMFQWASNHKYLNFFNVSDKCTAAEGKDCAVAELYIHAGAGGEEFQWAPVKVFQTFNSTSGARVRTTAGESIDARAIVKSEVKFFTDHPVEAPDFRLGRQCFYLDETFCEPFHREQRKYDLKLMVEVVCFVIWAIAFLMAVKRLLEYVVGYCQKGTRRESTARAPHLRRGVARAARLVIQLPRCRDALQRGCGGVARRLGGRQDDHARARVSHPVLVLHNAHAHLPARLLLGCALPVLPLRLVRVNRHRGNRTSPGL